MSAGGDFPEDASHRITGAGAKLLEDYLRRRALGPRTSEDSRQLTIDHTSDQFGWWGSLSEIDSLLWNTYDANPRIPGVNSR